MKIVSLKVIGRKRKQTLVKTHLFKLMSVPKDIPMVSRDELESVSMSFLDTNMTIIQDAQVTILDEETKEVETISLKRLLNSQVRVK